MAQQQNDAIIDTNAFLHWVRDSQSQVSELLVADTLTWFEFCHLNRKSEWDKIQSPFSQPCNDQFVMVLGRVSRWLGFSSESKWPEGQPVKLPNYFPVQPKGCESVSQTLFDCVGGAATDKQRDIEQAGYHKSYFAGIETKPLNEKYAEYVEKQQQKPPQNNTTTTTGEEERDTTVPRRGENPLEVCQLQILNYQRCCERALKKKQNWILTEPYRVQKEYRYNPSSSSP